MLTGADADGGADAAPSGSAGCALVRAAASSARATSASRSEEVGKGLPGAASCRRGAPYGWLSVSMSGSRRIDVASGRV